MNAVLVACSTFVLAAAGCSSSSGGPVSGQADAHCALPDGGSRVQEVSSASCHLTSGMSDDGGVEYGATLFNAEGNDDDCKYHVAWTSDSVEQNRDVTFTVHATQLADNQPAAGAGVDAEVFLSETHPAPNSGQKTTETSAGIYRIGPVHFDQPGRWTVRFHLHEDCSDVAEDSPHGHVAFYVEVP